MQVFGKASDGLCVHETVMNLKVNYSLPGRKKKNLELGSRNLLF